MALGYEIGTIMQRNSVSYFKSDEKIMVKVDHIVGVDRHFVQIQGKDRNKVADMGRAMGLEGTYYPHSYIEIIQLENLTQEFLTVSEDLKRRFSVNGEPLADDIAGSLSKGSSPLINGSFLGGSYHKMTGFNVSSPAEYVFSSSAPIQAAGKPLSMSNGSRKGLLTQKMNGSSGISIESDKLGIGNTPERHAHYEKCTSPEGSSRSSAGTTRPDSPHTVDTRLKQLLQSQALLTSQIEELTMQLRMMPRTEIHQQQMPAQKQDQGLVLASAAAGVSIGLLLSFWLYRH